MSRPPPPPPPWSPAADYEAQAKRDARSVLLTDKNGLTLRAFRLQHRKFLGRDLDHKRLGAPTLLHLLRRWGDVLTVAAPGGGPGGGDPEEAVLRAVPDSKTMQLYAMVQRQKDSSGPGGAAAGYLNIVEHEPEGNFCFAKTWGPV